ncbi:hypothetical protein G6F31_021303 [Rhizopus arrhizus]|nr:hypothetical protein G6F31_021303 [Rhizopus arrhizus]
MATLPDGLRAMYAGTGAGFSRAAPILRLRIRTKKAAAGFPLAAAFLRAAAGLSPCGWSLQPGDNRTGSSPGPGPRPPGR